MSSPFLCSKPFLHDVISALPSPTSRHPTIRLKPSPFPRCSSFLAPFPSFSAALSTSKPRAAKLLDKIPNTECSHENTFSVSPAPEKDVLFTGFSSSRQGKEEENGILKKSVDSSNKSVVSTCGSEVEKHMMEIGITPEEHELEALLRASVEAGRGEKVYHLLHKLRTIVSKVSPSTADAIDAWFRSSTAVRVGKRKWDNQAIKQAMENGGGGWHGLGWLGKGKWNVVPTRVDGEGVCLCCGEKLVSVDLDPVETESFAECVESIVIKKERNSNFEKFQKWLEYYGPFEAVIDAANVGLFNQRRFSLNKVNAVANGIRQKLLSKKWPLIIIHNKRLLGGKMNEPCNIKLIEKWKNADAIYETPTGSNDDCYKMQMLCCYQ
ncbi:hypothetical protein KSP39_PZI024334 [Platanthera zijinensis]|uniref:ribonuclease P n=1 Tax=Platanthera zijinensis TaxID=2320716 RepID=A0AAP0ATN2_9ASPA